MLCMTEAPAGCSEEARALWAWLRASLALGLLESWAGSESAQVCPHSPPVHQASHAATHQHAGHQDLHLRAVRRISENNSTALQWMYHPAQVAGVHAEALVEGMQLWELPAQLLPAGRLRAASSLLLRAFQAAAALGDAFFGSALQLTQPPLPMP